MKGCVIRAIFQLPSTHVFLLSTKENKKSIGDFKKQKRLWTRSKEDARRRTIHGKYIQQGQGGGGRSLGGGLFPKGKLSRISTNSRAREGQGGGAFALGGGGGVRFGGGLSQRKMIQFLKL